MRLKHVLHSGWLYITSRAVPFHTCIRFVDCSCISSPPSGCAISHLLAEEVVVSQTHLQEVNSQGLLIFKDCENNSIAEGKCSIKEYYLLQLLFFNDCGNNQKYLWDEIPCSFCHLHKFTAILYMVETRLESGLEPSRLEPSSHARTKMEAVRWCIGKH